MWKTVIALILLALLGVFVYVRLAPMDAERWHADPDAGARTGKPNDILIAADGDRLPVVTALAPDDLSERIDAVAMAEPRTIRLAGIPEDGHVTYVQRSKVMGYPDAISVKVAPEGDGSRLTIWSRARFGHSDLGVNEARIDRWLDALDLP